MTSKNRPMVRIGILGGTFDPVHHGHLALADHFTRLLGLTELIWVPTGQPPQKSGVSAAEHRLAMTRLAAHALTLPGTAITVSTEEIDSPGPHYTVQTLQAWRLRAGPDASIALLIGADQLLQLDSWHEWQRLFDYAHICAAMRPGFDLAKARAPIAAEIARRHSDAQTVRQSPSGGLLIDSALMINISATAIRAQWRALASQHKMAEHTCCQAASNESIVFRGKQATEASMATIHHVPAPVWHYICQHRLYET